MIPNSFESQLRSSAQQIIARVCQDKMRQMERRPSSEVDFISSLIENGAGLLEHGWKPILAPAKIDVSVAGIFCHQSPKVEIKGPRPRPMKRQSCELADLLVLHSHRTRPNKIYWRGALIQTKMYSSSPLVPEDPQFWLYDNWPIFSVAARGFDKRNRDFDGDIRSGRYALVSNSDWKILPPNTPLVAQSAGSLDFDTFLVRMLYDMDPAQPSRTSSHGRQVYHKSSKDWSKTIWDIVEVTAKLKLKHMGKEKGLYPGALQTRLGGHVVLGFLTAGPKFFLIPPDLTGGGEEEYEGGMSILHIASSTEAELSLD
jgi:hypothetical protein